MGDGSPDARRVPGSTKGTVGLQGRVPRDASLDEFFGVGKSGVGSESDESEGEESAAVEGGVAPASATYVWSPDGSTCARCGGSVDRLWRCDGELVCEGCKEW